MSDQKKPAKTDSELEAHRALKEILWQNHSLALNNLGLLTELHKANKEILALKTEAAKKETTGRPGIRV